jgi:hypothetical protein
MPRSPSNNQGWAEVQTNPTYLPGSLPDSEGGKIKWHSPRDPASSQVFCISAFAAVRGDADLCNKVLHQALPHIPESLDWQLQFEYTDEQLLGETGQGIPTNIDVFCTSRHGVICVESKFLYDAREGFGGCGQLRQGHCSGFYGAGSDLKTRTENPCRLEMQDGERGPRRYWQLGRAYFQDSAYAVQQAGQTCPFALSNYQLMRNFLFAATAAGAREFGVVAIVPDSTASAVRAQVLAFQNTILKPEFRAHIAVASYDLLALLLMDSPSTRARQAGRHMQTILNTLNT